jgi:hypothetical protein
MAIAFRSAGAIGFSPANNIGNPNTLSPGAPSGKAVGDNLVLITFTRSITATVGTPSG